MNMISNNLDSYFYGNLSDSSANVGLEQSVNNIITYLIQNSFNQQSTGFVNEIIETSINATVINPLPFFKFPTGSNYENLYPNFTEYLKNSIPQLRNNTFIINKLMQYSELPQSRIINDLKWGRGPTIVITQLDTFCDTCSSSTYGLFSSSTPDILYVDIDIVNQIESSTAGNQGNTLAFLLGVTILHEYVHLGDFVDGVDQPGEEGLLFEEATYGESIWINNAGDVIIRNNP